jgi:glucose/arabinose dehydrogenase
MMFSPTWHSFILHLLIRLGILALLILALVACGGSTPAPGPGAAGDNLPPPGAPLDYDLTLPAGFRISVYASGLDEVRKLTFGTDNVPYVTIMNRVQEGTGKLLALPDRNGDGQADEHVAVLEPLDRPHGLVYYQQSLYVSEPHVIHRIIDQDGDLRAESTERVVDGMPAEGDHWSRPFVFDNEGNILVAIGSSCNATCTESDERRATIYRYGPNGTPLGAVARGLRSVVDLAWQPGTQNLWAVNNGRDWLGPSEPPDSAHIIRDGAHYGWPFCFADLTVDAEVAARDTPAPPDGMANDRFCATQVTPADLVLPPHVAPLGVTFYTADQFPPRYQGGMFMAWHGAFDFSNTNGYRVAFVPFENGQAGQPETFINWLMPDESGWLGRPVGVTVGPEGSLYVTDDFGGKVYRVDYVGE